MVMFHHYFMLCLIVVWIDAVESMIVIPERASVVYANPKYVENVTINVRRYSRKSLYYVNVLGITKHTWNNNITVGVRVNQFLHNEFRPSFVQMHHKFCDLVNDEPFVGGALKTKGVVCPLAAGYQDVRNLTAPTENYPSVFPFEKGSIDFILNITSTGEAVLHLALVVTFKQRLPRYKP